MLGAFFRQVLFLKKFREKPCTGNNARLSLQSFSERAQKGRLKSAKEKRKKVVLAVFKNCLSGTAWLQKVH